MKYNEDSEDIEFPAISFKGKEPTKNHKNHKNYRNYCITIMIIAGVIVLGILIFIIIYFTGPKHPKNPEENLIVKYFVESEKEIILFNPPEELNKNGYKIEVIEDNKNRLRNLEDKFKINNNKLKSKVNDKIKIKITFEKEISSIAGLFKDCENLLTIEKFNLKKKEIKSIDSLFLNCKKLEKVDLTGLSTDKVEVMNSAFENCERLDYLNLASFKTTNLKSMKSMFKNCTNLDFLDLSNFQLNEETNIEGVFNNTNNLKMLLIKDFNSKAKLVQMTHILM